MITLNLLPDIKKEYLKANRTKSTILTVAFFVSLGVIFTVVLMSLYVLGVQRLQISNSQDSIDKSIITLQTTEDLDKTITIQNQLNALPALEESTIAANRLFDYLTIVTPNDVSLNTVIIDYQSYTVEVRGTGKDFKAVNTFVDTLKNASYTYEGKDGSTLAFSSVVLDSIGSEKENSPFKVTFAYEPAIFDPSSQNLKLTVPSITSTRSQTEKPKSLFEIQEETE